MTLRIAVLAAAWLTFAPVLAQDDAGAETDAQAETEEPAEAAEADEDEDTLPEIDDQSYLDADEEDFRPSEEIPTDQSISFPTDI